MNNEQEYQYNSCISRGICSINPTTASLQEVIILYLKTISFYGLKLEEMGIKDKKIFTLVLNTISMLSSNYEISAKNFEVINSAFQTEIPRVIEEYEKQCSIQNLECEKLESNYVLNKSTDINDYIRLGEKEFRKRLLSLPSEILNLYRILFLLTKSIAINLITYEGYGYEMQSEQSFILKILNLLNYNPQPKKELKKLLLETADRDCELMLKIRTVQENKYGKQEESQVSFTTTKGKAMLVIGSNLRELEHILEELKNTNIDIYTHDNMMLAHTFPKFKEYKNLKGQFGQGMENCLLDFSTFPGPIILTKNSLYNVENLYRGRLFTTDFAYSKGVIPIKNNDFSEVISSAENSRGFRTGKDCASEKIGFSYDNMREKIDKKLKEEIYTQIIVIGTRGYSKDEDGYFKTFLKHIPKNILVISFTCCKEQDNILCINAEYDNIAFLKFSKYIIKQSSKKVNIFFPFCDRHTLSIILNTVKCRPNKIFVGNWNQIILKPNILESLKRNFGVLEISTPKKDLSSIDK